MDINSKIFISLFKLHKITFQASPISDRKHDEVKLSYVFCYEI